MGYGTGLSSAKKKFHRKFDNLSASERLKIVEEVQSAFEIIDMRQ